ncbi:MAG: histidine kinase [Lachnospiraceae bacterium]|nr:histidine kinase [Lachnospiraceae bacterium]
MKKRKLTIKMGMVWLMLICWFLPFLLVAGIMAFYMFGDYFDNKMTAEMDTLSFNSQVCTERLDYAVELSKSATYNGNINRAYELYRKQEMDRYTLLQTCDYQLRTYRHEICVQDAVLWLWDSPDIGKQSTFNESTGGTYRDILTYEEEDHDNVKELARNLGTGTAFYANKDRLYLVRNMVDRSFDEIATLVLRLNTEYCFANLTKLAEKTDVTVQIEDTVFPLKGEMLTWKDVHRGENHGKRGYYWKNNVLGLYDVREGNSCRLTTMLRIQDADSIMPLYGYRFVLFGMLVLLLPLLFLILKLQQKYLTRPIAALMKGAAEIEKGNLGYQMEEIPVTEELMYLTEAFNEMSEQLKYQFDHIYEEEIALRDARIMALQSHINPHFMNNTLEIINWEARMNGDEKVSEMIEALSVLMDATIDRKKQPEVRLSEEMEYVNAYLRILKERLGKRLVVRNELPESIMDCMVPRLILQPIIENAVEHGAIRNGSGTVILKGRREGRYLYLEIYNDGGITKEEEERVQRLLAPGYDTSREPSGNLGIANVNQRLKILYGDSCGLCIQNLGRNQVRTRLTILV